MYQPIENYGVIGDLHTVALISIDGSLDWLCFPRFDSPTVFAALLDDKKGGRFKISPTNEGITHKQLYWPATNVLITRFLSDGGVGEVTDYMPVGTTARGDGHHQVVRRVRVIQGELTFRVECTPAFNYAQQTYRTTLTEDGAVFQTPELILALATKVPLEQEGEGVSAEFTLRAGESAVFTLRQVAEPSICGPCYSEQEAEELFLETVDYWQTWLSKCTYTGRWRETVYRSALVLKLLTYAPTGAIIAAPTFGLPESIGGERNWDYRYAWIRDAAFTVYALMRIGLTEEATQFVSWLDARCHEPNEDGSLQIVYGIDGRHDLPEQSLDHLEGYRGSRPVRIGNAAHSQLQLDIYGELMDAVYLYNKHAAPISYELWTHLRALTDWVCENWRRPDEGIWEVRGERRHFVYSKLMCWVALDRALRLADKRSFPAPRARWLTVRDDIYEDIVQRGYSKERGAFVQSYGSETLDASNLLMPLVLFMAPNDPQVLSTVDAIKRPPRDHGLTLDCLVYRYDGEATGDGLEGKEGTFSMCSFWLVEALTRAGWEDPGRLVEGRILFERMLCYSNHLGLYSEELGLSGEMLGNYPQAFTHLALISAAVNLDRALDGN